jgi:hypothetical protein
VATFAIGGKVVRTTKIKAAAAKNQFGTSATG